MKKTYFLIVLNIFICNVLIGQSKLELIVPSSHSGFLKGLELDYSQKYLFTISNEDVKMWEVESKNKIKTFKGFNNIICSPNGEFFVIHNYTNIEIYHYRNFANPIKLIFEKGISSVSFFSNSKKESERLCVLDYDGNLHKINTSNGNALESIQIKKFWVGDLSTKADYDSLLLLSPDTVKFLVRKETGEIVGSKRYRRILILSDSLLYRIEKKWGAENHKIIYRDSEMDLLKLANINFDNILFEGVEFGPTYNGEVSLLIRSSDSSILLTIKGGIVTSRTELPKLGEFKGKYKFSFDGRYLVYFCFQKGEKLDVSVVFDISKREIISEIEETDLFNFSSDNKNILYNSKNKIVISPLDQSESTVINFVEDWWGNCFDSKMDFALSSQNASNSKRKKTEYYSWNFKNPREIERMEVASNSYFGFQGAFNAPLFISDSMLINLEAERGLQVYNRFNGKTREVFNNSITEGLSHLDVNKNYFFSSKSEFENYLYILNLNEKLDRKIPFTWKAGDVTRYWAYLNEEELLKKERHNVVLLFDSISCSFFDVNSFQLLYKFIESDVVYSWHYNGGNFLEYSKEDSTFIWDISTKRKILGIENDKSYSLNPTFSKNNEKFLYRTKNFLHVFDLNSRNEILKLDLMSEGLGIKVEDYIEFELHGNFLVIDIKSRSVLIIYDIDKRIFKFKYSNFEYQDFDISDDLKYLLINESRQEAVIYSIDGKRLYTRCQFGGGDWLVYDEHYRFDGTPGAIEKLYFTCGLEVIDLAQMKDALYVPGLVGKIMNGEDINYQKLSDLDICGALTLIEKVNEDKGMWEYRIQQRRWPIVRLEVKVDGKTVITIPSNDLQWDNQIATLQLIKKDLKKHFKPGEENKVIVIAITEFQKREFKSRGEELTLETQGEKEAPNFYMLMIGVNDYKDDALDLRFPVQDARALGSALESSARKLLGDGKVFVYNVQSKTENNTVYTTPEKAGVIKALEEIGKKAKTNDVLFIFFAGHGVMQGADNSFTFLTADASKLNPVGISTTDLKSWLSPEGPFHMMPNKTVLVYDACNSGQASKELADLAMARDDNATERQRQIEDLGDKSGVFILSASAPNQSAYELPHLGQGMLTYSLLTTLKNNPGVLDESENGNGFLNLQKWFLETEREQSRLMQSLGLNQDAQPYGTANIRIGIVDDEVREGITLMAEKPLVYCTSARDDSEEDPLELKQSVNAFLETATSRGTAYKLGYIKSETSQANILKLVYSEKGDSIECRILIFKNKLKINEININTSSSKAAEDVFKAVEGVIK